MNRSIRLNLITINGQFIFSKIKMQKASPEEEKTGHAVIYDQYKMHIRILYYITL